jgi:histidinol phosphatase-like enzyme
MEKSFYVGDAAGRKDGKKKDFSDTDLKFAANIGIPF